MLILTLDDEVLQALGHVQLPLRHLLDPQPELGQLLSVLGGKYRVLSEWDTGRTGQNSLFLLPADLTYFVQQVELFILCLHLARLPVGVHNDPWDRCRWTLDAGALKKQDG